MKSNRICSKSLGQNTKFDVAKDSFTWLKFLLTKWTADYIISCYPRPNCYGLDPVKPILKGTVKMNKFFTEYRTFIRRGNVVDMAVGVIVGSAFTAIVNSLSNSILSPLVNYLLAIIVGKDSLSGIHTFLIKAETTADILDANGNVIGSETVVDLAQSVYIDWGAFISAVVQFFLIAFVLFTIVKIINKVREENLEFQEKVKKARLSREQRAELKTNGIKRRDKAAVTAYFAEKQRLADEAAAKAAAEAAEADRLHREANPTTEDLLKMILAEIKK